jgi:hypothetical protein
MCEPEFIRAQVTAIDKDSVDLTLDNGARLYGWRGAMYDAQGNEISLESVRRGFVTDDSSDLLERIAALEILLTEV